MEILTDLWTSIVPFLVILTVVVFVHELGHYLVARRSGVRVEVFSIGFGKEIWGWNDRHGTRWRLSLIPLGGYVRFFGEASPGHSIEETLELMTPEERAAAYTSKRVGQRFAIVAAGPLANLVFACLLLAGLYSTVGQPYTPAEVMTVIEGSAAEEADLRPGDLIVRIDDTKIERFEEMQAIIGLSAGRALTIVVIRDGAEVALTATPRLTQVEGPLGNTLTVGRLGVARKGADYRRLDPLTASWSAVAQTGTIIVHIMDALGQTIVGTLSWREQLGGPIRIVQWSGKVAEFGIVAVISFIAGLSIVLGLVNLFPIPALDGGHLMFCIIEAIRGRPVGERVQDYSFRIGIGLLLTLMVLITWNDLIQIGFFEILSRLFS